jgi:opacity protein-like surface antigen
MNIACTSLLALCGLALSAPARAQSWSAELYGGGVFERSEEFAAGGGTFEFDLKSGAAFGAALYSDSLASGVELGVDLMGTRAGYVGFGSDDYVNSLSLMAVGRLPFALGGGVEGYAGAGLGAIRVEYDDGAPELSGDDTVLGGQIGMGARYAIAPGSRIFGELRHQIAFDDAEFLNANGTPTLQSYSSTSLLIGIGFDF